MLAYIGRRALLAVFTVWAISVLSFAIIQLPPGDYVTSYIAQMASMGSVVTDEEAQNLRIQYGLGQPIYVQYYKWVRLIAQGKEPEPKMRELMDKWKKAFGVPEKERIQLGKEVWKITAEEVYIIGVIGMGPASMGVRVVKTNMGNIPSRQYNSPDGKTPTISRPVTFFWKK